MARYSPNEIEYKKDNMKSKIPNYVGMIMPTSVWRMRDFMF